MQISFQYTAFIWHILHNQCIYTISCQSHKWKQKQQQQNFIESHGKNTSISVLVLGFKIIAKDLGPRWYTDSFGSWNKLNKTSFRDLEKIYFWIMWNTLYHIFYKKNDFGPEIQKICIWVLDLPQLFKWMQKILTNLLKLFSNLQKCNYLTYSQMQRIFVNIKINIDSETPLNIVFSTYIYHIINLGIKKQR